MNGLLILLPAVALLTGCAGATTHAYVGATAWSANYTEDYIHEFHVQTATGEETGLEGIQVSEFSKGGQGGQECCSFIPAVGQTLRLVWTIADRNDKSQWKTYSENVTVTGKMPKNPAQEPHSVLIVRFFANHEVETELLPGDGNFSRENPRVDKLFFAGPRVLRHKGE